MAAATEESPLIQGDAHELVYKRFSTREKRTIVALICWSGLIPMFVSGTFVPSIPQIAKDLNSTGPIVSLAISISVFTQAFGCLVWATYAGFYGRRPIFLSSFPLLCIGSLGVGQAQSISHLMVWRVVQAFGSSYGMSVGGAVIGDIYKLDERGSAMGLFFGACLLGPALAPLTGGTFAHYASWRQMQNALCICGLIAFVLVYFFLPETSHPGGRGIDRELKNAEAKGIVAKRWHFLNPFKSLMLLRSPNLMAITLVGTTTLLTDFVLLMPLAYTIGKRYNITNEALIGACFIPDGVGNIIGAPLAGHLSDRIVVKWRERRAGVWVPEDRLRAASFGALVLVPVSILLSGLIITYIGGVAGLVLNLVMLFINGIGVDLVLTPCSSYLVDVVHGQSAEMMAANSALRSLILAAATTAILPSINAYGVAATDAGMAVIGWIGYGLLWATIKYGDKMRAWVDVGYSTERTN